MAVRARPKPISKTARPISKPITKKTIIRGGQPRQVGRGGGSIRPGAPIPSVAPIVMPPGPTQFVIKRTRSGFVRVPVGTSQSEAEKSAALVGRGFTQRQRTLLARGETIRIKGRQVNLKTTLTKKQSRILQEEETIRKLSPFAQRVARTLQRQGKAISIRKNIITATSPERKTKEVIDLRRVGKEVIAKVPRSATVFQRTLGINVRKETAIAIKKQQEQLKQDLIKQARARGLREIKIKLTTKAPVTLLLEKRARLKKEAKRLALRLTILTQPGIALEQRKKREEQLKQTLRSLETKGKELKEESKGKGIKGFSQKIDKIINAIQLRSEKEFVASRLQFERRRGLPRAQLKFLSITAAGGAIRGAVGILNIIRSPVKSIKELFSTLTSIKKVKQTAKATVGRFAIDPVGVVTEFAVFSKGLGWIGKGIRATKISQFVSFRLYLRSLPKVLRKPVGKILTAADVQKKLFPTKLTEIKNLKFAEIQTLSSVEVKALAKTLKSRTDSVVFGSAAGRALAKTGRLKLAHDLDLATANIKGFTKDFISNIPRQFRRNYIFKSNKLKRLIRVRGKIKEINLMDLKPLSDLINTRGLIKSRLPLAFPTLKETFRLKIIVKNIIKKSRQIKELNKKIKASKKNSFISKAKKRIKTIQQEIKKDVSSIKLTDLSKSQRELVRGVFTIETEKLVEVRGVQFITFGEQTARKAQGTLRVLIEKAKRRQKDPLGFTINLQVQVDALKKAKPKTVVGRKLISRKLIVLEDAIKTLTSEEFARLLESRVKGITKKFPIKIESIKTASNKFVKRLSPKTIRSIAKSPKIPGIKQIKQIKKIKSKISKLPKKKVVSVLPKIKPSRIPKVVPSSLIPIKARSMPSSLLSLSNSGIVVPSFLSFAPISQIPSKLSKSQLRKVLNNARSILQKASRLPSKVPPSKVPPSKLPPSILPPSKLVSVRVKEAKRRRTLKKIKKIKKKKLLRLTEKKKVKKLITLSKKVIAKRRFIYLPDLYSVFFDIKANPAERRFFLTPKRLFTGLEIRKIIGR